MCQLARGNLTKTNNHHYRLYTRVEEANKGMTGDNHAEERRSVIRIHENRNYRSYITVSISLNTRSIDLEFGFRDLHILEQPTLSRIRQEVSRSVKDT